jgi:hypothetical protein
MYLPKTITEIRSLPRGQARTALNVLVDVMRNKGATPAARVSAANAILDCGRGKATQPLQNGDDGALELIHRIERVMFDAIIDAVARESPGVSLGVIRNLLTARVGTCRCAQYPELAGGDAGSRK